MSALTFNVVGLPAPQGSKRHVGNGVMVESSKRVKPWRQDVKYAALAAMGENTSGMPWFYADAVRVHVTFRMPRPKSHYRTGRNAHLLRDNAPHSPASKPDLDKLLRSTFDALGEARVWADDSKVVEVIAAKAYEDSNFRPGAVITIRSVA